MSGAAGRPPSAASVRASRHFVAEPLARVVVADLAPLVAGRSGDELVFTSPQGGPLQLNNRRPRVCDEYGSTPRLS
jgi:hypothetical protein